jgi:hypothetical protein
VKRETRERGERGGGKSERRGGKVREGNVRQYWVSCSVCQHENLVRDQRGGGKEKRKREETVQEHILHEHLELLATTVGHFLDLNEVGLHVLSVRNMLASRACFNNLEVEKEEREREKYVNRGGEE